jgi:hypothetical protein
VDAGTACVDLAAVDSWLAERLDAAVATAAPGREARFADGYQTALGDVDPGELGEPIAAVLA